MGYLSILLWIHGKVFKNSFTSLAYISIQNLAGFGTSSEYAILHIPNSVSCILLNVTKTKGCSNLLLLIIDRFNWTITVLHQLHIKKKYK